MFGVCARKLCSAEARGYDKLLRSAVVKYIVLDSITMFHAGPFINRIMYIL